MKNHAKHMLMLTVLILAASMINAAICAAEEYDTQGWGINDPYNQHFDVTKYEKFRAWVVGFRTEPPLPGMSPGTIPLGVDLALTVFGAAARSIEKAFGALGHGTNAAGFVQNALPAFLALLHGQLAGNQGIHVPHRIQRWFDRYGKAKLFGHLPGDLDRTAAS